MKMVAFTYMRMQQVVKCLKCEPFSSDQPGSNPCFTFQKLSKLSQVTYLSDPVLKV